MSTTFRINLESPITLATGKVLQIDIFIRNFNMFNGWFYIAGRVLAINDGLNGYEYIGTKVFSPTVSDIERIRVHFINHKSTSITINKFALGVNLSKTCIWKSPETITTDDYKTVLIS